MDLETYSSDAIGVDNCTEIREQVYSVCADWPRSLYNKYYI
jgi:hypothetical protein